MESAKQYATLNMSMNNKDMLVTVENGTTAAEVYSLAMQLMSWAKGKMAEAEKAVAEEAPAPVEGN